MATPESEALQNSFRIDAIVHNGHIWSVDKKPLVPIRLNKSSVTELHLPAWYVWPETGQTPVYAGLRHSSGNVIWFSNRPRDEFELRRDSEVYDLGREVLHREVICDNFGREPLSPGTAFGIGRSLVGEQMQIVAANSGDMASLTVMLTNMHDSTQALPRLSLAA